MFINGNHSTISRRGPFGGVRVRALIALLCGAMLAGLGGCGTSTNAETPAESRYSAVGIVVADTTTNPAASLTDSEQALIGNVMTDYGSDRLIIVSAGGQPRVVSPELAEFDPEEGNATGIAKRVRSNMLEIEDTLAAMGAKTPEQSTFEAIAVAADFLSSAASADKPALLLVHSNGLDSTGAMDMTTMLASHSSDEIAKAVREANTNLSLGNVALRIRGLGYVADDAPTAQKRPTAAVRSLIETIWSRVLEQFSPASLNVDRTPVSGNHPAAATGKVTPVRLPSTEIRCDGGAINYEMPSSLLFAPNSAEPNGTAKGLLGEPAAILRDNPTARVTVTGHAYADPAYGAEDYQAISESRARAVADLLRDAYGIDAGRITARGVGATQPAASADGTSAPEADRRVELTITGVRSNGSCRVA
ncbi:OmpA family protein [Bifidobacterium sp. MA2]|uniref:OmpA family protein n=1 Tax=Bifidobacterium santillanense TaxID=2809028 RepID=A0ABS5USI9_9BIFI|nr:OmpA family protein [Bifidobacterium santillanense]MBT1173905.1 OmpA family protein [Bifidobacterium santillanense]